MTGAPKHRFIRFLGMGEKHVNYEPKPSSTQVETLKRIEDIITKNVIDTIRIGAVDIDGVWRGKQISTEYFLTKAATHGTQISDILFGWDVSDKIAEGLSYTSWDTGFPDVKIVPDLSTFALLPWEPGTASVLCDIEQIGGGPVSLSPRYILQNAIERALKLGFKPFAAYEFEFYLLDDPIGQIAEGAWRSIRPASKSGPCYSMLHHASSLDVMGQIRKQLRAAGCDVEATNSEYGPGQYEINVSYSDALDAADTAVFLKCAIKEIAAKQGLTATFMAKPRADWAGSSGHVHFSLSTMNGENAFASSAQPAALSDAGKSFLAGMVGYARDMSAIYLPNINSYKRKTGGSWSGGNSSWGFDNRTVSFRALPSPGRAARIENRIPGADTNPYLVIAAGILTGLHGIETRMTPTPPFLGNAYKATPDQAPPLANSLEEAVHLFQGSDVVKSIFSTEFIRHYIQIKNWELLQSNSQVTDWELARYLEII